MKALIYIAIFFVCFSCKKDELFGERSILVGTWKWQTTTRIDYCSGYLKYTYLTLESTAVKYKLVFLKKGIIQFYKNDELLREHKIKFHQLEIQKEGIVESHKKISFLIYLDGDSEQKLYGDGTPNKLRINDFPYWKEEDCISSNLNYFRKE